MEVLRRTNPLLVLSAAITLFLTTSGDPWWSVAGTTSSQLLSVQVSPFYLHTTATGLVSTVGFSEFLGPLTRILLILSFVVLGMSSLMPSTWWREFAAYFGLSVLIELYFSLFLNYHAAETLLLGAYGIVPPYSGTSNLPAIIVGLDLKTYVSPLVTAGFSLPFYVGFLGLGLLTASIFRLRVIREPRPRGVEAIFTAESD